MGALIPTPNDLEVVAKLNERFSSHGLSALRYYQTATGDDLFAPANRTLERVCVRLGIYPTKLPGGRGRWLYFLANILKPASGGVTYSTIQNVLRQACAKPPAVDSVIFNVLEAPVADYFLYPNNGAAPEIQNPPLPSGLSVYLITLVCPATAVIPHGYDPPVDGGEPPNPIIP
jgi:hypothetical protein